MPRHDSLVALAIVCSHKFDGRVFVLWFLCLSSILWQTRCVSTVASTAAAAALPYPWRRSGACGSTTTAQRRWNRLVNSQYSPWMLLCLWNHC